MKKLKLIILIFVCQQITFGQTNFIEYENSENLNLKGNVKTIKETSFTATKVNDQIVKSIKGWQYDWENDQEYYFDSIGNLVLKKN